MPAGPDTWRIGEWAVYRSVLPEPVFWLSNKGRKPERIKSREEVIRRVSEQG